MSVLLIYVNKLIAIVIICIAINLIYSIFSYLCGILTIIAMLVCIHNIACDDSIGVGRLVYHATCKITRKLAYILSWL